jgi:hypothetical protein
MKTALFIGLWLTISSLTCSNINAMDKTLKSISNLVAEDKIDKTAIEATLGVRLSEDKKASASQGMTIYELSMGTFLSDYDKVELRVFDGGARFFLLIDPETPVPLPLEELKKLYSYKGFTPADTRRHEPAGYHFEKNGHKISYYCDNKLKRIVQVTIEGKSK